MHFNETLLGRSRRAFLEQSAGGIGLIALWHLLAREAGAGERLPAPGVTGPRPPHYPAKAKNVIFLFMAGGPSQLDLYDPKPEMKKWDGQPMPTSIMKNLTDDFVRSTARVMASPRTFQPYGACGMEISDYLPHTGSCADDLCLVRSMFTAPLNHHPAQLFMNCGIARFGHPSFGSWVSYGLGSESQNLPGFVVLTSNSGKGIEGGTSNWSSGFLPSDYRGVTFRSTGDPVLHLSNPIGVSRETQRARLDALRDLNELRFKETGESEIESRIASYELAYRMQSAAPELLKFSNESPSTLEAYGINKEVTRPFGTNCLLARRMVESGVRFVQLYHSTWDDHKDLNAHLKKNCDMTDQPTAALLKDLKQRGLLDSTLVVWEGEFGRTPMSETRRAVTPGADGRDHHAAAFSMWLAGGGIKGGQVIGKTDELGVNIIEDKIHVHDLQATLLHCLGLDHTRLTYRHQGQDFRLTDVGGEVVKKLLS